LSQFVAFMLVDEIRDRVACVPRILDHSLSLQLSREETFEPKPHRQCL